MLSFRKGRENTRTVDASCGGVGQDLHIPREWRLEEYADNMARLCPVRLLGVQSFLGKMCTPRSSDQLTKQTQALSLERCNSSIPAIFAVVFCVSFSLCIFARIYVFVLCLSISKCTKNEENAPLNCFQPCLIHHSISCLILLRAVLLLHNKTTDLIFEGQVLNLTFSTSDEFGTACNSGLRQAHISYPTEGIQSSKDLVSGGSHPVHGGFVKYKIHESTVIPNFESLSQHFRKENYTIVQL